ncbi:MAG TPA: DUF2335 domain-containing protein [Actinomycetales bacterium]
MTTPDETLDAGHHGEGVVVALGELPSADTVEAYEQVLPGAADRILGMLERQAEHRMDMERALVEGAARSERLGQLLGLGIVLIVFAVAARLISTEHELSGTVLAVCDLGVLASVYWRRDRGSSATVT